MLEDTEVRGWANELWHRREELPPELWKEIARIERNSGAPGTANVGRWITAAALRNLTTPERGKLTAKNWPVFYEYFVVELARLAAESGAVTAFKKKSSPLQKSKHQSDKFVREWNHLVKTGEFPPEGQDRIRKIGKKVDTIFRSYTGQTLP